MPLPDQDSRNLNRSQATLNDEREQCKDAKVYQIDASKVSPEAILMGKSKSGLAAVQAPDQVQFIQNYSGVCDRAIPSIISKE